MDIKYQIFISSPYEDLLHERDYVVKAALEMGHIPISMEMFSAADEDLWKTITRHIDTCDYYVVIVAHRYGSVVDGVSYTEKEFDYAISKGIPVLGFIIDDGAAWPADRIDTGSDEKALLGEFKAKLKERPVSFWSTAADLTGKFSIALMKQIPLTPRPGWIRTTDVVSPDLVKQIPLTPRLGWIRTADVVSPDVVNELSRLISENPESRRQLQEALHKAEDDAIAERKKIRETMRKNSLEVSFFYDPGSEWEDKTTVTLYRLFHMLAPEMMVEQSTADLSSYVGVMLRPNKERQPRRHYPVPSNWMRDCLSDFLTLGVVEPSQKRHSVSDKNQYWALTNLGRAVYTDIRRAALEEGHSE